MTGIEQPTPGETPEDWQDSDQLSYAEISAHEMATYHATIRRIQRFIGIAGILCALAALWPLGWPLSVGVLLGTALSLINFRWLASSVNVVAERVVQVKSTERGAAVVARGVGRIFLIAFSAYVIFNCSVRGLVGYLAGLAMPVLALMTEAVYEFVALNRRSS
jgi:hypothetical protein